MKVIIRFFRFVLGIILLISSLIGIILTIIISLFVYGVIIIVPERWLEG